MNPLIEKILQYNQVTEEKYNQLFNKQVLSNFENIPNMDIFVERIMNAKKNNEKVFIAGDYDADGICSTAIMIDTLQTLGIVCGYYIPNRILEGYGLHVATVEKVVEKKYQLIITVDNGVKAFDAIKVAQQNNVDILVSDHHEFDTLLPCPLLHSFHMQSQYRSLSGAGIALAIAKNLGVHKKEHVILTGIALLADMMPVWDENRVIIQHAVQYLKEGIYPQIQLFKSIYDDWNEITILYNVVPKINAVGRLADKMDVNKVVQFLISDDNIFIQDYYQKLCKINELRKLKSVEMMNKADMMLNNQTFPILYHHSFHEGIVGIVAGKIASEHQKPVMVLSEKEDVLKGSIRSIKGLNLVSFFEGFKHHFLQFGGHEQAAGVLIEKKKLQLLHDYIAKQHIPSTTKEQPLLLDKSYVIYQNVMELENLRPFGVGFNIPMFALKVENFIVQKLGKNPHYKMSVDTNIEILFFNEKNFKINNQAIIYFNQITIKKQKIVIIASAYEEIE